MKKRSMLAVASIAVGFVASLTAPSAHAAEPQNTGVTPETITAPEVPGTVDPAELPDLPA
jgi:hypothetical protein